MEPIYAARYRELYERHWWWRARESLILSVLEATAPEGGFGPILDVGCGDGLFFDRLRRFGTPCGVEPDESLLTERGRAAGEIHVGAFADYHPSRRFGLILFLDVLEHLRDPGAALTHAGSMLVPDGLVVITVPAFTALWTTHDDHNQHLRRYRASGLRAEIETSQLEVEALRYFFHWLFLAKAMTVVVERLARSRPGPASVPAAGINGLVYHLCRLEQRLTSRLAPPLGSSILAVARGGR